MSDVAEEHESHKKLAKASDDKTVLIDLKLIRSNHQNVRKSLPRLDSMGFGVFERNPDTDKPCLMELATSSDVDQQKQFLHLIESHGGESDGEAEEGPLHFRSIVALAGSIHKGGQINPVHVRHNEDGESYDLIAGCRRCVAIAYNAIKMGVPIKVRAFVVDQDDTQAGYRSFSENAFVLAMNPMSQARHFAKLKNANLKPADIQEVTGVNLQTVRNRMKLLSLDEKTQAKVESGEIPYVKALELAKKNDKPHTNGASPRVPSGAVGRGHRGDGSRRGVPTLAQFKTMYQERKDLNEKVREFIALEILEVEYETFAALTRRINAENKAVEDEKAKKKAEAEAKKKAAAK